MEVIFATLPPPYTGQMSYNAQEIETLQQRIICPQLSIVPRLSMLLRKEFWFDIVINSKSHSHPKRAENLRKMRRQQKEKKKADRENQNQDRRHRTCGQFLLERFVV